ncbi:CvpA family protein [Salipaludibacillus sp. CF4.18]|uniref:CvpA family protein n=1 Tax=Salipaludibacillus sp. CF4.18 TaxID=3373081 RepID=UPI003EE75C53
MLSFILFFILIMCFFIGFRRGFILQVIHLLGLVVSFVVAYLYYQELASYIRLWIPFPQLSEEGGMGLLVENFDMEMVYYNGIAFAALFIITKIIMQVIGSLFDFIAHLPILHFLNGWLGGILGFIEGLVVIVVLLHLAALVQVDIVQSILQGSSFAQMIFEYTPIISDELKTLWIEGKKK